MINIRNHFNKCKSDANPPLTRIMHSRASSATAAIVQVMSQRPKLHILLIFLTQPSATINVFATHQTVMQHLILNEQPACRD